jgi:hypothetical protein
VLSKVSFTIQTQKEQEQEKEKESLTLLAPSNKKEESQGSWGRKVIKDIQLAEQEVRTTIIYSFIY